MIGSTLFALEEVERLCYEAAVVTNTPILPIHHYHLCPQQQQYEKKVQEKNKNEIVI